MNSLGLDPIQIQSGETSHYFPHHTQYPYQNPNLTHTTTPFPAQNPVPNPTQYFYRNPTHNPNPSFPTPTSPEPVIRPVLPSLMGPPSLLVPQRRQQLAPTQVRARPRQPPAAPIQISQGPARPEYRPHALEFVSTSYQPIRTVKMMTPPCLTMRRSGTSTLQEWWNIVSRGCQSTPPPMG